MTAESPGNISIIFQNPLYVKQLINMVGTDTEELKKEAAWVLCSCSKYGVPSDIFKLVEWEGLESFESILDSKDSKTVLVAVEGITNILSCGMKFFTKEGPNPFLIRLEKTKAISKLEDLQYHPSQEVYQKVASLLEAFFETSDSLA